MVCAQCGQVNPEGARFCNGCAAPITAEVPTAREERKVVTILFADLVGFTRTGRADAQLQQALAFYRSVGATAYTREAEASSRPQLRCFIRPLSRGH